MKNIVNCLYLVFFISFLSTPIFSQEKIRCYISKKISCGENECINMEIPQDDTRIIDISNKVIFVGPDQHSIKGAEPSGAFLSFKFGGSAFLKMTMIEGLASPIGSFMEVRDLHLGSIISWGRCNL